MVVVGGVGEALGRVEMDENRIGKNIAFLYVSIGHENHKVKRLSSVNIEGRHVRLALRSRTIGKVGLTGVKVQKESTNLPMTAIYTEGMMR